MNICQYPENHALIIGLMRALSETLKLAGVEQLSHIMTAYEIKYAETLRNHVPDIADRVEEYYNTHMVKVTMEPRTGRNGVYFLSDGTWINGNDVEGREI